MKMEKYTVKQARVLSDLSAREVAKRLGLCTNAYLNKEKGLSRFYIDEAMNFAEIVGMPLDNIFFAPVVTQK